MDDKDIKSAFAQLLEAVADRVSSQAAQRARGELSEAEFVNAVLKTVQDIAPDADLPVKPGEFCTPDPLPEPEDDPGPDAVLAPLMGQAQDDGEDESGGILNWILERTPPGEAVAPNAEQAAEEMPPADRRGAPSGPLPQDSTDQTPPFPGQDADAPDAASFPSAEAEPWPEPFPEPEPWVEEEVISDAAPPEAEVEPWTAIQAEPDASVPPAPAETEPPPHVPASETDQQSAQRDESHTAVEQGGPKPSHAAHGEPEPATEFSPASGHDEADADALPVPPSSPTQDGPSEAPPSVPLDDTTSALWDLEDAYTGGPMESAPAPAGDEPAPLLLEDVVEAHQPESGPGDGAPAEAAPTPETDGLDGILSKAARPPAAASPHAQAEEDAPPSARWQDDAVVLAASGTALADSPLIPELDPMAGDDASDRMDASDDTGMGPDAIPAEEVEPFVAETIVDTDQLWTPDDPAQEAPATAQADELLPEEPEQPLLVDQEWEPEEGDPFADLPIPPESFDTATDLPQPQPAQPEAEPAPARQAPETFTTRADGQALTAAPADTADAEDSDPFRDLPLPPQADMDASQTSLPPSRPLPQRVQAAAPPRDARHTGEAQRAPAPASKPASSGPRIYTPGTPNPNAPRGDTPGAGADARRQPCIPCPSRVIVSGSAQWERDDSHELEDTMFRLGVDEELAQDILSPSTDFNERERDFITKETRRALKEGGTTKSPSTAFFLSLLLPGFGSAYAGNPLGILFAIPAVALGVFFGLGQVEPKHALIGFLALSCISAFTAYINASEHNRRLRIKQAQQPLRQEKRETTLTIK